MADDDVDKEARASVVREWKGSRLMRSLLGWDPCRESAFDVKETPEGFQFHADMPGIQEKDLAVTVNGNRLTISGTTETHCANERTHGSFTRSFTLPNGADVQATNASLKDGVLEVFVPKKAAEQPKKVAIKT